MRVAQQQTAYAELEVVASGVRIWTDASNISYAARPDPKKRAIVFVNGLPEALELVQIVTQRSSPQDG